MFSQSTVNSVGFGKYDKGHQNIVTGKTHVCSINHTASSGAMEAAGAIEMFRRSIEESNLMYHEYLGGGDTSSIKAVVDSKPYAEFLWSSYSPEFK